MVISIIAILIALLLPALAAAQQLEYMVDCESNLVQIGLASIMYEQTWQGYVPNEPYAGANITWDKQVYNFLTARKLTNAQLTGNDLIPALALPAFICPDDPPRPDTYGAVAQSYAIIGTFGIFGITTYPGGGRYPNGVRIGNVPDPTGELYLTDGYVGDWSYPGPGHSAGPLQGAFSPPNFIDSQEYMENGTLAIPPHSGGRFNYLFLDGRVESLRYPQTIGKGTLVQPLGMWDFYPGH